MTDADIREWLDGKPGSVKPNREDLHSLLKELLEHRNLRLTPCWRVWVPDSSPQGWRWVAAFPSEETARLFREAYKPNGLILPHNEQPALTAR